MFNTKKKLKILQPMKLPQRKLSIKITSPFGAKKVTSTTILEGLRFRMPNIKFEEVLTDVTPKNTNVYKAPTCDEITLKISNIPLHLTKQDIYKRLDGLNVVVKKIHMVHDKETKIFKGYAYMSLYDLDSAKAVMKQLEGTVICSQALAVEFAPVYNK